MKGYCISEYPPSPRAPWLQKLQDSGFKPIIDQLQQTTQKLTNTTTTGPAIAVTSRRLHDMNVMGWAAIATMIPTIGQLISIGVGLPAGNAGDNKYGPNPLGPKS